MRGRPAAPKLAGGGFDVGLHKPRAIYSPALARAEEPVHPHGREAVWWVCNGAYIVKGLWSRWCRGGQQHHNNTITTPLQHAQELVQLNVLKGMKDTLVSKELMGRASVPLRPLHDKPGEPVDAWYDLGKGEWSNEDGTVRAQCFHDLCACTGCTSPASPWTPVMIWAEGERPNADGMVCIYPAATSSRGPSCMTSSASPWARV